MLRAMRKPAETALPRMGPLPKLPVFVDLAGRRAVVTGGSAAAAWKAELLAAAGALVDIYATDASSEMTRLVARGAAAGTLTLHATAWHVDHLAGAVVAIADAADDTEAAAFFSAARAAGALVNVIDTPAFCQFQLGSIVNRAPVVIAISTDGGAPILAQAIRRRIETLLPATLSAWGLLAKTLRDAVSARLAPGAARRAFWERFAERAMTEPIPAQAERQAHALIDDIVADRSTRTGRVTLVGVGPGDAELLTLKAVRAMQSADVILFDDLVSDDVLELARREAKRMAVGKRGRRDSCAQGDINALMLDLARQGKHVVRLKSGDPMIFGRAGEEIAELEAAGIAVAVVPGVTAALAMASSLGVSLTHRDYSQSVRFVTGHSRNGELPSNLDWPGLADAKTTLVFYMGVKTAPQIAERLIEAGLSAETPAVMVSHVSRPDETRWRGTLSTLGEHASLSGADAPAVIGIGTAFASVAVGFGVVEGDSRRAAG